MTRKFTTTVAVLILAALGSGAFAEDTSLTTALIKRDLYKNFDQIQDSAKKLDESQRNSIFSFTVKDPASDGLLGAAVNLLVGFGLGSFVIGDKTGGVLGLCLDLSVVAADLSLWGLIIYGGALSLDLLNIYYVALVALPVASRAIQVVRPFVFISRFNDDLADALLLSALGAKDADIRFAFLPGRDGLPCPGLSLSVRI
jgi:hypothetical protein